MWIRLAQKHEYNAWELAQVLLRIIADLKRLLGSEPDLLLDAEAHAVDYPHIVSPKLLNSEYATPEVLKRLQNLHQVWQLINFSHTINKQDVFRVANIGDWISTLQSYRKYHEATIKQRPDERYRHLNGTTASPFERKFIQFFRSNFDLEIIPIEINVPSPTNNYSHFAMDFVVFCQAITRFEKNGDAIKPVVENIRLLGECYGHGDENYQIKKKVKIATEHKISRIMPNTATLIITDLNPRTIMDDLDKLQVVYKSPLCSSNNGCLAQRLIDKYHVDLPEKQSQHVTEHFLDAAAVAFDIAHGTWSEIRSQTSNPEWGKQLSKEEKQYQEFLNFKHKLAAIIVDNDDPEISDAILYLQSKYDEKDISRNQAHRDKFNQNISKEDNKLPILKQGVKNDVALRDDPLYQQALARTTKKLIPEPRILNDPAFNTNVERQPVDNSLVIDEQRQNVKA